jgi:hypothetical protein
MFRKAAAIARLGREHVLEAKSLLMVVDVLTDRAARRSGQEQATGKDNCFSEAALAVLGVCRPLAGWPDYMLTIPDTGAMPRIDLDLCEAKAWLALAREDLTRRKPDAAGCRQKLQEHALRLFASV